MSNTSKPTKLFNPFEHGLPVDVTAERFVLGAITRNDSQMALIRDALKPGDFALHSHALIWERMCEMFDRGEHIDYFTLGMFLDGKKELEKIGGLTYLTDMEDGMPINPSLESYIEQIHIKSLKRRAIIKCNEVMLRLASTDEDAASVFTEAEESMGKLNADISSSVGFSTPREIIEEAGGTDKYLSREGRTYIETPWIKLNHVIEGFRPGQFTVIAAKTSKGKTAFVLQIAHHAAKCGYKPVIFSLEASKQDTTDRLIASVGGLNSRVLRWYEINPVAEQERIRSIRASINSLAGLDIFISDTPAWTVPGMKAELRRLMVKRKVDLVIVDYIQLASGAGRFDNRTTEVGSISRGLKRMALDLHLPVIALSQFSRKADEDTKPPELHHLRESGSIEHDGNLIMFLHYTQMFDTFRKIDWGELDLIIAKQTSGPTGMIPMKFHAPSGVFYERD